MQGEGSALVLDVVLRGTGSIAGQVFKAGGVIPVVEAGGHEPTISVTIEAQRLPGATGDDGLVFATVDAIATSVPISRYPRS